MARGNNRMVIFKTDADYLKYFELIIRFKNELPFDLYHYCLMPNHNHMLVKTRRAEDFSMFMKKLNLAYFYYFKKHYGWVGHLWQDRFKSQPVGKDEYFIQCGKYIEFNSVRAGLAIEPSRYSYSSYKYYVLGQSDDLLTEDIFYRSLGKSAKVRQQKYSELVIGERIVDSYKKQIWGSGIQRYNEKRKINYHENLTNKP